MVWGFIKGQGIRDQGLTCYWSSKGQGYLEVGILYRENNLGEMQKQRQPINDEACPNYQGVYEYVEKVKKNVSFIEMYKERHL